MKNRILAAVLAACMVLTLVGSAAAAGAETGDPSSAQETFSDVGQSEATAWYYPAVYWAVDNGITNGTQPGKFSPDNFCTRAQVVTFLWRAAGKPAPTGDAAFADVHRDQYYYPAVLWAVEQGITTGVDAGHFAPDAVCTRGMVVTFLWRTAQKPACPGAKTTFSDVASGAYCSGAVQWAVGSGITNGTGKEKFQPDAGCSRAQVVTFLYRAATAESDAIYLLYNASLSDGSHYRIPQFRMDSPDAQAINRQIEEKFGGYYLEEKANDDQGFSVICCEIGYALQRYGDFLSLVVYARYFGDCVFYSVYNIDTQGRAVENQTLLQAAGITQAEFVPRAQQAAARVFAEKYPDAPHDRLYEEQLAATIAPQQIHSGMRMFLGDDGKLMLISAIGSLAGASSYEEVYALETA